MRAFIEQWKHMAPPPTIGRDEERAALLEALRQPGNIVEVVAAVGMGKTTLLKRMSLDAQEIFGGAVEYFVGSPTFPLSAAVDTIAEKLREARGHSLLVIDDGDLLKPGDTLEAINRLSTGPWSFSTVIASHNGVGLGERIVELSPLAGTAFEGLLKSLFDGALDAAGMERLWEATRGNPLLARLLGEHWRAGKIRDVAELTRLLQPWRGLGLLGPDGRPLQRGGPAEQRIITDVREISEALLRQVADNPRLLYEMPPRRFEELVAELLTRAGYTVTLTPQTRDGGKDMYAARRDQFGSFLYVVECKRHSPDRPVGVGVVRAVHGVAQHERATAAMVMTTSYFTGPAREFAEDVQYQIALSDYFDLRHWLTQYGRGP
jgi:restriction system protein